MKHSLMRGIVSHAVAGVAIGLAPNVASATQPRYETDVLEELERVTAESESPLLEVLENVTPIGEDQSGEDAMVGSVNGFDVAVPESAEEPISMTSALGKTIDIEIPFAESSERADVLAPGVAYGYAFWAAGFTWDMEKARANYSNWNSNPSTHHCNW